MDIQLAKIIKKYPSFFHIIQNALPAAYKRAQAQMNEMLYDDLCRQRMGYFILTNADHTLRHDFENIAFDGVEVYSAPNANRSNLHLEIRTPYAIFMVAKVSAPNAVPPKAQYRQKYSDQVFMAEVFPEYELFSEASIPLYIVTHTFHKGDYLPKSIHVGRLSMDQRTWEYNVPIEMLCKNELLIENIEKENVPIVQEEIASRKNRIKIKTKEII